MDNLSKRVGDQPDKKPKACQIKTHKARNILPLHAPLPPLHSFVALPCQKDKSRLCHKD